MSDRDLPASTLATIEQRVKRRIRRQLTMAVLTLALAFTLFMASATQWSPDRQVWGMMSGILLLVWIPYVLWYVYRALVERGVRREIERERQHQLQLAREGGRVKRVDRFAHLTGLEDDRGAFLSDDGELIYEDDLDINLTDKPKRRMNT
jgi:hypothetical protein